MKRFKFTAPTPERCIELGIKFEGLQTRTQLWLMGVASGVAYISGNHFNLCFANRRNFLVDTDSMTVLNNVKDWLEAYGYTCEEWPITSAFAAHMESLNVPA